MKQFIKNIFLFVPFSLILYAVLICLWGNYAPLRLTKNFNYRIAASGHMFTRLKEVKTVENVDILFLGSSHTYRGFDTSIFGGCGYETFNLGSSSQTLIQTLTLANRYLHQLNPKLVLLEVYPGNFTGDGVESSVDVIANDKNDWESFKMAWTINHITTYNTLIYGLYRDWRGINTQIEEPIVKGRDTYIEGGFVRKAPLPYLKENFTENKWRWEPKQLQALEELLILLKKNNIPYYLIQAPITTAMYQAYTNNQEFDELMSQYGSYFNFNELLTLEDSLYFYDGHHLNQQGVKIFNKKIIELLIE